MKPKNEYRKIQGVNPVPSSRTFNASRGFIPAAGFWDIFVSPENGGDDHLVFTIRAADDAGARAAAKRRLMTGGKWRYFDLSSIRAESAKRYG